MNTIINFAGHFHPLFVHLPIGILLFAILIHGLTALKKYEHLNAILPFTYLVGACGAIFSCITGYALASDGDYNDALILKHQWLGISVAILSIIGYIWSQQKQVTHFKWLSLTLLFLIFLTGHYGGTLTHGEGYLTSGLDKNKEKLQKQKVAITNAQEAVLFTDIIQPILEEKCYNCHSSIKQKGKLRLDEKEWIMKGGLDGIVIHIGDALNSALYKRITLDPSKEEHMPPKGKPQITDQERMLIEWWINTGADFTKKVKGLQQTPNISAVLKKIEQASNYKPGSNYVPTNVVKEANTTFLNTLKNSGVTIYPVANNSNYLTANFITVQKSNSAIEAAIQNISENLIWIKMPGMSFTNQLATSISTCTNLTKLSVEHSTITDNQLNSLNTLTQLEYLNITDTKISLNGLLQLTNLKKLGKLFVEQTSIQQSDSARLQKQFPLATINFGHYQLEKLIVDTQILKAPPRQ